MKLGDTSFPTHIYFYHEGRMISVPVTEAKVEVKEQYVIFNLVIGGIEEIEVVTPPLNQLPIVNVEQVEPDDLIG